MIIETTDEMDFQEEEKKIEDFELFGGTRVEIIPGKKKLIYLFKDEMGNEIFQRKGDIPAAVTETSEVGKEIKRLLDPDGRLTSKALKSDYLIAMQAMQEYYKSKKNEYSNLAKLGTKEKEFQIKESVQAGYDQLNNIKSPLLWIASLTDWYAAGERMNILYAWIAYCSQVILHEPISVIAEGEGGTGKTHIIETALSMIPSEFIEVVKTTTEAALYGYCDEDPNYFDGKIVNIGDMGGKTDHEEAENFKNAMKELQSDGYMARIKQVPKAEGGYENHKYELFGKPCITYTNVPGHQYDDQELSRSILLRPRNDHKKAFMVFKRLNKQKGTDSANLIIMHHEKINVIRNMVRALRERMETVTIYNPYWSFTEKYLDKSKYIFRDTDKYDGILRVITAINGYNRRIYDINGQPTIFTTREDISFFLELLAQYHNSIVSNLSPGAMDVLTNLQRNAEEWFDERSVVPGLTIAKYIEESRTTVSKRSIQKYFKELEEMGYLLEVGGNKRENFYQLGRDSSVIDVGEIRLSELDQKIMEYNYGSEATFTFEEEEGYGVSLQDMHPDVESPLWNKYLPKVKVS